MKISEFKKLIREEVRKIVAEAAIVWNRKSIEAFFAYLQNDLGIIDSVDQMRFITDTTGRVSCEIGERPAFVASFAVDPANPGTLVLKELRSFASLPSDFSATEFVEDFESEAPRRPNNNYNVVLKGKRTIMVTGK